MPESTEQDHAIEPNCDSSGIAPESIDPRIRRTRQFFQDALGKLLEKKDFDSISVQEIAEAAALNRATFYDHYTGKSDLLESLIRCNFGALLAERNIHFDGTCPSAWRAIILAVCDFLARCHSADPCPSRAHNQAQPRSFEPIVESTILAQVRLVLLKGLQNGPHPPRTAPPELLATIVSWAIYGAAREWASALNRPPAEEFVEIVVELIRPILTAGV